MRTQRVTIQQVAAEAGVSKQTVSRVLNHKPDVADTTRIRVLAIIDRLGYRPSHVARSLSQKRSFVLGVATAELGYSGPSKILNGIVRTADELGYSVIIKEITNSSVEGIRSRLEELIALQVDGIIWAVPEVDDNREWVDAGMDDLPVPILFLTMAPRDGIFTISFDNFYGGKLATKHMIDQGRKNIDHITGPLAWWEARQRKAGWEMSLRLAGFLEGQTFFEEGDWSPESGEKAFLALYARHPEIDAVFVGNDRMALGVFRAAFRLGFRIPDDLAVVGFDGIPEGSYFIPPLSTIKLDHVKLGRIAVGELAGALIKLWEEGDPIPQAQSICVKPELLIRESSVKETGKINIRELERI